jgi:hypothetical protein
VGASVQRVSSGATLAARLGSASERWAPKKVVRVRHSTSVRHERVAALAGYDPRLTNAAANREERHAANQRKRDLCTCHRNSGNSGLFK